MGFSKKDLGDVVWGSETGRDPVLQAHPQGRPGQHGKVPLAGPATAAGSGTSQLRRTAGGGAGTPLRRTHRPVPRAYGSHAGTTAAHGWAAVSPWSPGPELKRIVSNVGDHHISKSQQRRLAALEPVRIDEATVLTVAGKDVASNASATWGIITSASPSNGVWPPWNLITWGRTPPPTQKARWKAIQQARLNGLSLRAIAKEHGIARDTVRKYDYAEQPPTKKLSAQERATESATQIRNRRQLTKRNFRFSFNRTESLDNNSPHQRD